MTPAAIRKARADLGMTQAQFADVLRLSDPYGEGRRTVRRWENGQRTPSGPVSVAIEALLSGWRPE